MDTKRWRKTFLAVLLAVMMALPSVAGIAEDAANFENQIQVIDGVVKVYDPDSGAWVEDPELTESLKLNGDLSVLIEEDHQYKSALEVAAKEEDSSFEVAGSVEADVTAENEIYTYGVSVRTEADASADVTVDGNVIADGTSEGFTSMTGVHAEAEGGEVNVHVAGDVETSSSGSWAEANGVYAFASVGGDSEPSAISVTVDGKVTASTETTGENADNNETAVFTAAYGEQSETNITIGEGAEGQIIMHSVDGGSMSLTIRDGGVTSENPHTPWGGEGDSALMPSAAVGVVNSEGAADIDITGNIAVKNGEAAVYSENNDGETTINITGDIAAEESHEAVWASSNGKKAETTLTIEGSITAGNDEKGYVSAVGLAVKNEGLITATLTGDTIEATGHKAKATGESEEEEDETMATGLELMNDGGDLQIEVVAGITASGADSNIGVLVSSEGEYESEYVIDEDADPVQIDDEEIYWSKTVIIGDEEVDVVYYKGQYYKKTDDGYLPVNDIGGMTYSEGNTNLTITGDVTADIGMYVDVPEVQTANITVDGTITGETAGIVLQGDTQLGDNLTMTVWEVKPNEDNAIVIREKYDEEKDEVVCTEDKVAEKLIQYIIKIEDNSRDYIATNGTTDFTAGNGEKYQVAHEGDKVLVKLNIPEGKELVGAYWDKAQSEAGRLLKDAEGNYYLEVPRGGGVMLSVTLKDAPKPEPQPAPIPVPDPAPKRYSVAEPIVTARDLSGMVTISFYASRNYVVTLEDGSKERGTFEQIDGEIFLQSGDREITIANDGIFTYICQIDVNRTYHFVLSQTDLDALLAVK